MINQGVPIPYDRMGVKDDSYSDKDYQPTDEEKKTIELVENLHSKAKKARSQYDEKWVDYYKMFRGRQWSGPRPSYRHSEVVNLIFRAIQSEVPIVMDTRPKIEFIPTEPGDYELSQILNDLLDCDWNDGNWLAALTEIVYDSRFYGTGFGSVKYDPEAALGEGRIIFKCEDTFSAFPDPHALNVNVEANYFILAEPYPLDRLKREYPEHRSHLKSDLLDMSKEDRTDVSNSRRAAIQANSNSKVQAEGSSQYTLDNRDEALKLDCFIHDLECIEDEVKGLNAQGQEEVSYIQRLKYPNGRKMVVASGVLLEDEPMPYDDKKFPYLRLLNYVLPHEFWGISEIEQLESPQKIFNKLVSFSLDVLTLMGNPIWIVDNNSDIDTSALYNRPGLIVEKNPGSEVRREEGVQLQPYVLQLIDSFKLWFDDVSGSNDVSRGNRPEGVTAASAITALQDAQQTRVRQKMRNLDAFLQDMGKMYVSRVFQYYTAPRVFRVTGLDSTNRYFKFHIDKQPVIDPMTGQETGEVQTIAKVRNYETGVDGKPYEGEEKAMQLTGEFDVRVTSGSGLPFEKSRIEAQSYQLFDRQIIDAEEVMKQIKFPNGEAVIKRMQEKAAAQQQAQAQQDQASQQAQAQSEQQAIMLKQGARPL